MLNVKTCISAWYRKSYQITDKTVILPMHSPYFGQCYLSILASEIFLLFLQRTCQKIEWMNEGNVLFNDTLNTFYLWLYGVRHMVKDHSYSKKGNLLPPHGLLFPISSKGSFICIIQDRIIHTTAFVTPIVEHWLERTLNEEKDMLISI